MRLVSGDDAVIRHHLAVMRLIAAINCREGIQPERLNAEGDSPSDLSRGLVVIATPGIPTIKRKEKNATIGFLGDCFRVLRNM